MPPSSTILFVALTFILAGVVKGTIGLGLPTVAIGLLGLVMPTAEAAALLVVPSLATNAWQLLAGPPVGRLMRRLWPMLAGIAAGTVLAAGARALVPGQAGPGGQVLELPGAKVAMGAALVAYGLFGLARVELAVAARWERVAGPVAGLANGAITVATGTFVLPSVPYLQSLGLERDDLIQALGLSFTVSTLCLATALAAQGAVHAGSLGGSCLLLAPALLGMWGGTQLRDRIRPAVFRACFFAGLVALGAELVVRG